MSKMKIINSDIIQKADISIRLYESINNRSNHQRALNQTEVMFENKCCMTYLNHFIKSKLSRELLHQ